MNAIIDKNDDKEDNTSYGIDSDGTVDKHANNKKCVQNQAGNLNYSSTTSMESSVGISHLLITPMMNNITTPKRPVSK